jgi:hypothetical protein
MQHLRHHSASGSGQAPPRIAVLFALLVLGMTIACPLSAQSIIYVDIDATGANDGSSWADAFVYLQDALAVAQDGDEVWVAEGVYRPDQGAGITPGAREASFLLRSAVQLYGGFTGTETARDARDPAMHETVLSGDLLGNDNGFILHTEPSRSDNSLQVVLIRSEAPPGPRIVGFTVRGGNGFVSASLIRAGAGISVHGPVSLQNLVIRENTTADGSIFVTGTPSRNSVQLSDILFENNRTDNGASGGGGLALLHSGEQIFHRLTFLNNFGSDGGAIFNKAYRTTCIQCVFFGNESGSGGAVYNEHYSYSGHPSTLVLVNSIVVGNRATWGGAFESAQDRGHISHLVIVNSIVAGNTAEAHGGAIWSSGAQIDVVNSTLAFNTAGEFGGLIRYNVLADVSVTIRNSLIWGNTAGTGGDQFKLDIADPSGAGIELRRSLVEGDLPVYVFDDGMTIHAPPAFVDPYGPDGILGTLDDDYRLLAGSPAIDVGGNNLVPYDEFDLDDDGRVAEALPVDLDLRVRIFDGGSGEAIVDLGPYEFGAPPVLLHASDQPVAGRMPGCGAESFPNPFSERFILTTGSRDPLEPRIALFDMLGRRVPIAVSRTRDGAGNRAYAVTPGWTPAGAYLVKVIFPNQTCSTTITRIH